MVKMTYLVQCLFLGAGIVVLSCSVSQPITPQITGGDVDQHGCIPSAGYVWSELQEDCLRPFELDLQLITTSLNDGSTHAQYVGVLFAPDRMRCEIFIEGKSPILELVQTNRYFCFDKFIRYELEKIADHWELRVNNSIHFVEAEH